MKKLKKTELESSDYLEDMVIANYSLAQLQIHMEVDYNQIEGRSGAKEALIWVWSELDRIREIHQHKIDNLCVDENYLKMENWIKEKFGKRIELKVWNGSLHAAGQWCKDQTKPNPPTAQLNKNQIKLNPISAQLCQDQMHSDPYLSQMEACRRFLNIYTIEGKPGYTPKQLSNYIDKMHIE